MRILEFLRARQLARSHKNKHSPQSFHLHHPLWYKGQDASKVNSSRNINSQELVATKWQCWPSPQKGTMSGLWLHEAADEIMSLRRGQEEGKQWSRGQRTAQLSRGDVRWRQSLGNPSNIRGRSVQNQQGLVWAQARWAPCSRIPVDHHSKWQGHQWGLSFNYERKTQNHNKLEVTLEGRVSAAITSIRDRSTEKNVQ